MCAGMGSRRDAHWCHDHVGGVTARPVNVDGDLDEVFDSIAGDQGDDRLGLGSADLRVAGHDMIADLDIFDWLSGSIGHQNESARYETVELAADGGRFRALCKLPGLLAATRTGLPPEGLDDLINNKIICCVTASLPVLLGARTIEVSQQSVLGRF
jgi:hypothetical protein